MTLSIATLQPHPGKIVYLALGLAFCLPSVPAAQAAPGAPAAATHAALPSAKAPPNPADGSVIVAIVNGDVISAADVDNRRRLFALTTGLPVTQDVLDRLTPQVTRQLVDERLRFQETKRRKIIVTDQEIANAIADIESSNGLPPGGLRERLASRVSPCAPYMTNSAFRSAGAACCGRCWAAAPRSRTPTSQQQAALIKAQTGQPEFRVSEIFVPISDPAQTDDARRFSDTVIQQLRAGAPFAVMAAEFSQAQNALQGGDLGWMQPNQLDPAVLRVLQEMPVGAVSNPIRVPGGISIVTLRAKRLIGSDPATMVILRQVLFRFTTPLDPNNPTAQQRQALEQARHVTATAKSCDDVEAAAKEAGDPRGGNPGPVRLETVSVAPPAPGDGHPAHRQSQRTAGGQ